MGTLRPTGPTHPFFPLAVLLDAGVSAALDELDVREGEVADLAVELALPLPRDVHLGHRHDLAHLQPQRRLVVRARHPGLLHPRVRRKFALKGGRFNVFTFKFFADLV